MIFLEKIELSIKIGKRKNSLLSLHLPDKLRLMLFD